MAIGMGVAKHVPYVAVLPYVELHRALRLEFPDDFDTQRFADFRLRTDLYDEAAVLGTDLVSLWKKYSTRLDPVWERHFFGPQRQAVADRGAASAQRAADLAGQIQRQLNASSAAAASDARKRGAAAAAGTDPKKGKAAGKGATLDASKTKTKVPSGLMHEKLVPHKGQGKGCPKFHFEGELDPATGKGCDGTKCPPGRDSHACPLKACNHAKHSFKVFHPDLT